MRAATRTLQTKREEPPSMLNSCWCTRRTWNWEKLVACLLSFDEPFPQWCHCRPPLSTSDVRISRRHGRTIKQGRGKRGRVTDCGSETRMLSSGSTKPEVVPFHWLLPLSVRGNDCDADCVSLFIEYPCLLLKVSPKERCVPSSGVGGAFLRPRNSGEALQLRQILCNRNQSA